MNWFRRLRAHLAALPLWVADGLLALLVFVVGLGPWLWGFRLDPVITVEGPAVVLSPLETALAVLSVAPLAFRRMAPVPVLLVVAAAELPLLLLLHVEPLGPGLGLIIAVYTVAAYRPRRASLLSLALLLVTLGLGTLVLGQDLRMLVNNAGLLYLAPWILGDRKRVQRGRTAELVERAEELQRQRDQRDRLAVSEERARIARELHDVLAHSVSVMVVQSAAARRVLRRDPEAAERALVEVEGSGRASLVELRRLLGLLRESDGRDASPLVPVPDLTAVGDLVEEFRRAGLPVEWEQRGVPHHVSPGVALSTFRIVQEGLTNALKHAGAARVRLTLTYEEAQVVVRIDDDGRGPGLDGGDREHAGYGLIGMRERAALVGGEVTAGPRPGGGFRVQATLPNVPQERAVSAGGTAAR